jgi:prolipoprotein diacylglyceryltransferase
VDFFILSVALWILCFVLPHYIDKKTETQNVSLPMCLVSLKNTRSLLLYCLTGSQLLTWSIMWLLAVLHHWNSGVRRWGAVLGKVGVLLWIFQLKGLWDIQREMFKWKLDLKFWILEE